MEVGEEVYLKGYVCCCGLYRSYSRSMVSDCMTWEMSIIDMWACAVVMEGYSVVMD